MKTVAKQAKACDAKLKGLTRDFRRKTLWQPVAYIFRTKEQFSCLLGFFVKRRLLFFGRNAVALFRLKERNKQGKEDVQERNGQ